MEKNAFWVLLMAWVMPFIHMRHLDLLRCYCDFLVFFVIMHLSFEKEEIVCPCPYCRDSFHVVVCQASGKHSWMLSTYQ